MPIARGAIARIRAAAVAGRPREACGLLFAGRAGATAGVIRAVSVARNIADAPLTRFLIDPAHLFAARRGARASSLMIVGCWHSHPGGRPTPSAEDAQGVVDRHWLWLIEADGVVRAFLPEGAGFRAVDLVEIDMAVVAPPLACR